MEISSHIGVISPFSLAEAIRGEKIPWTEMGTEEGREILERIFHLDYEDLFSPVKGESPLYPGFSGLETMARALASKEKPKRGERSPGSRKLGKVKPKAKSRPGRKNLAKRVSSAFRVVDRPKPSRKAKKRTFSSVTDVASGAPPPCTANVQWQYFDEDQWTYPDPPPPFSEADFANLYGTHPVQGCAADCYFVAALASLAWTDPMGLMGYPDASGDLHEYLFSHIDPGLDPQDWVPENIDRKLPMNLDTLGLAFAQSRVDNLVWPALYEKAYAIFKIGPGDEPDITQLNYGNAMHALCTIGMCHGTARQTSVYGSGASVFKEINDLCGSFSTGNKTKYPMVAWTYPDNPVGPGQFDTDVLAANHAYSILGTMVDHDKKYIVMRNPFLFSVAPPIDGVTGGTWKFTDYYCVDGQNYLPTCQVKTMDLKTTDGSEGDGTFAIEAGKFLSYFLAFGWIG